MATVYDQTKDPYFQGGEGTPNRTSATVVTSDMGECVRCDGQADNRSQRRCYCLRVHFDTPIKGAAIQFVPRQGTACRRKYFMARLDRLLHLLKSRAVASGAMLTTYPTRCGAIRVI